MNTNLDTIVAIATPPGRGGVGIVRISGALCKSIAENILGQLPVARVASYLSFVDENQQQIDRGIALYFQAPASLTGEDVLELQAHGGPIVLDMIMHRVVSLGARLARAGEFSERAFLNHKTDLAQAEAVADLIAAESESAAKAAQRSLQGGFSSTINQLVERITIVRTHVEAALDFSDEDIDFLSSGEVSGQLKNILEQIEAVRTSAQQGCLLQEGMSVVIAGPPNAGKSSLLNALCEKQAAIVTEVAGTTRDVIREHVQIDGLPLHIVDTAGLRESEDSIEREGVRRARDEISRADRALIVFDSTRTEDQALQKILSDLPQNCPVTVVFNKIDLAGGEPEIRKANNSRVDIYLSAKTGSGINLLKSHLKQTMGYAHNTEGQFIARRRHLEAIDAASNHASRALERVTGQGELELVAEELRLAQRFLNEITGEFSTEDLLGRIFSGFCVGK